MRLGKRLPVFFIGIIALLFFYTTSASAADDITGITLEKQMRAMIDKEIIYGYQEGVYGPTRDVTRGEFAAFITRALELPSAENEVKFHDVSPSSKLAAAIGSAYQAKLISGYSDGSFRPNENITREQMASIIGKSLEYLQVPKKVEAVSFTDINDISPRFQEYVAMNYYYDITRGFPQSDGSVAFKPKNNAKRDQAAAFIYNMLGAADKIKEEDGTDQPVEPEPEFSYSVAAIAGGAVTETGSYSTYDEALSVWNQSSDKVILKNGKIIKMKSGIAVTVPSGKTSLTSLYNESLTSASTYVVNDTELEYLDADEAKVKIQFAGRTAYVKQENVQLIPRQMLQGRSYYKASQGELYHYLFLTAQNKYVSYHAGKAPSFFQEKQKYYSWNGSTFLSDAGKAIGTAYQYFQYLPVRTKTNYTADELNRAIELKLIDLEKFYQSNPQTYAKYKDATTKSKLIGIGTYLKQVESEKKVNALHILSLAFHESDYGLSSRAQNYNNLFGLRVYDDNPANDVFPTVEANIDALINEFWGANYIPPGSRYGNGAVFGNKGIGFNVMYASDPYWGAKAAGHMYRIDKLLGGKDLGVYRIGLTNTSGLNVRTSPEVTSTNKAFTYATSQMPVVILEELTRPDRTWVKTISDDAQFDEVYIAGEYVDEISVVK